MEKQETFELNNAPLLKEERFRAILEALPDTILIVSRQGVILDCIKSLPRDDILPAGIKAGSSLFVCFNQETNREIKAILAGSSRERDAMIKEFCLDPVRRLYVELRLIPIDSSQYMITLRNISLRRQAQDALKESESFYRTIFETTGAASVIFTLDTAIVDANRQFSQLSGYTNDELLQGMRLEEFFLPEDLTLIGEFGRRIKTQAGQEGSEYHEARFIDRQGQIKHCIVYASVVPGTDKGVASLVDITSRREYEEKIIYYSFYDSLTGLYNRRFFEEELKRLDTMRNYPLTMILGDVNGMKLHNDTFGHQAGDKLLIKMAETIKKGCREDEIVARVGGDEFAIILCNTGSREAEQFVKRLQSLIGAEEINGIQLSISFGWACKNKVADSLDEVYKQAENMMYKHKLYSYPNIRTDNLYSILEMLYDKFPGEKEQSEKVAGLAEMMGKAQGFTPQQLEDIRTVSLLHNIGKVTLSGIDLFKPESLDEIEWIELKRHPETGYRILSSNRKMGRLAEYILTHHENWDGSGYPGGLKGEEIPLPARIVRIADAYTAMINPRSYRDALTSEEAVSELKNNAGIQFDPQQVELFLEKVLPQL
jgi:diguanylate cyclase (GGDEF)-like protein/PAS domain S-box-containing protein